LFDVDVVDVAVGETASLCNEACRSVWRAVYKRNVSVIDKQRKEPSKGDLPCIPCRASAKVRLYSDNDEICPLRTTRTQHFSQCL
jgi:hypothetical protein